MHATDGYGATAGFVVEGGQTEGLLAECRESKRHGENRNCTIWGGYGRQDHERNLYALYARNLQQLSLSSDTCSIGWKANRCRGAHQWTADAAALAPVDAPVDRHTDLRRGCREWQAEPDCLLLPLSESKSVTGCCCIQEVVEVQKKRCWYADSKSGLCWLERGEGVRGVG